MRIILQKKSIKSMYVYRLIEYWKVGKSDFELVHKCETYEEYTHLLNVIKNGSIDLDKVTEFKGISKQEIIRDMERLKDEDMFRRNTTM